MKACLISVVAMLAATLVTGQRPFFAGSKPIGYPELATTEGLGDRFGEIDGTTQRLPIEANGDRDLIDRLSKLPIDKQPFWFINWQALEANREKPQTYPQKPIGFIPPPNSGLVNTNTGTANSNPGAANSNSGLSSSNTVANTNINTENRFGAEADKKPISDTKDVIHGSFRPINHSNHGNRVVPNSAGNIATDKLYNTYDSKKPL